MSQMAKNKVEGLDRKKLSLTTVKKALEQMEKAELGEIVTKIRGGMRGGTFKVKGIGFLPDGDSHGVDIYMEGKELRMYGDDMGHYKDADSPFRQEFKKAYTAVAIAEQFGADGFNTTISHKFAGKNRMVEYLVSAEAF